jgi:hypothetical protein
MEGATPCWPDHERICKAISQERYVAYTGAVFLIKTMYRLGDIHKKSDATQPTNPMPHTQQILRLHDIIGTLALPDCP